MRVLARVATLVLILCFVAVTVAPAQQTVEVQAPVGFAAITAARQAYCEALFLDLPSSDSFREHLRIITANPHPAGSAAQVEVGHYIGRVMKAAGLPVREHHYDVHLPQLTDDVEAHAGYRLFDENWTGMVSVGWRLLSFDYEYSESGSRVFADAALHGPFVSFAVTF